MPNAPITSEAVGAYQDHVKRLARQYVGFANAELDDLVQEGLIAVWQSLARGLRPATLVIEGRMIDWVRYLHRLQHNDAVAYELMLPMESYETLESW